MATPMFGFDTDVQHPKVPGICRLGEMTGIAFVLEASDNQRGQQGAITAAVVVMHAYGVCENNIQHTRVVSGGSAEKPTCMRACKSRAKKKKKSCLSCARG